MSKNKKARKVKEEVSSTEEVLMASSEHLAFTMRKAIESHFDGIPGEGSATRSFEDVHVLMTVLSQLMVDTAFVYGVNTSDREGTDTEEEIIKAFDMYNEMTENNIDALSDMFSDDAPGNTLLN